MYEKNGSGWCIFRLVTLDVTVWKLTPLRGGVSTTFQILPKWIRNKHAVVNVRNEDKMCFQWSVLAALCKSRSNTKHGNIMSYYYKYMKEYNFSMLEFPVAIKDISKFENQNNVSVNVYQKGTL